MKGKTNLLDQYYAERQAAHQEKVGRLSKVYKEELMKRVISASITNMKVMREMFPGCHPFLYPEHYYNFRYDFSALKEKINTLPEITEKLKLLYEAKADYEQNFEESKFPEEPKVLKKEVFKYGENCRSEIDKYEKILSLEGRKNETEKEKKTNLYPPTIRKRIIEEAIRLSEKFDKWTEQDLIEELEVSKKTFYKYKKCFAFESIKDIRAEAKEKIRESER